MQGGGPRHKEGAGRDQLRRPPPPRLPLIRGAGDLYRKGRNRIARDSTHGR